MKISLFIGILHIVGTSCVIVPATLVNVTEIISPQNGQLAVKQNFMEINSSKDLAGSPSNRKAKRQSGRGSSKGKGPKIKNYSGPNGYHQVIESEPQSYSTSYHHSSDQPTKIYSNKKSSKHGKDTRSEREKNQDNSDYDYDDRVEHREAEKPSKGRRYQTEDDHEDDGDQYEGRTRGYERNSKYKKEKNDDYKKSGEIDFDTDDYYDDNNGRKGKSGGGGRSTGRDRYGSSSSNEDDVDHSSFRARGGQDFRGDASNDSNRRSSKDDDNEDLYEEVDSYGQSRRSGGRGNRERSNSNSNREKEVDDEVEDVRDIEENYRASNRKNGRGSTKNKKKKDEFDFEFHADDPYGERNSAVGRKYISSTI